MTDTPLEMVVFGLRTPEGRADPYAIYDEIRRRAPILEWQGQWFLTRHADVATIRDQRFVLGVDRSGPEPADAWNRVARDFLLFLDPPAHTRVRSLVTSAFTPRAVESLRLRVREIVDRLLDEASAGGAMDLIHDFAYPLPVTVICELLGLPAEHRDDFRVWSRAMAPAFGGGGDGTEILRTAALAIEAMTSCLAPIIASRRADPADDLLSSLIAASEDDARLSADELVANVILLFFGGHETTVNLIGNGTLALLRQRDQWERLVADPTLARNAAEELLRYDSPVQLTVRVASSDVEIDGRTISRGDPVNFVIAAANRDPEVFADPHRVDVARPDAARHLAFGGGIHYCVGAPLARLEAEIAFESLAKRLPGLRVTGDAPEWRNNMILRGLVALPVAF